MTPTPRDALPPGVGNAFLFAAFNALSFQIILSSPMVLYAKSLGASATILGIITGMMPLLVIFQIPAASHIHRYGYKRFVYGGWGVRVCFIFVMAVVPLAGAILAPASQLALLLFLLFAFNLSRGISSCAWLPWISTLIPGSIRGQYLSREAGFVSLASFATFLLAAACLGDHPHSWQFSIVIAWSALSGYASLFFLKRIPDVPIPTQEHGSNAPVPWLEISRHPPFRKLLRFNLAWSIAYGGLNTFTVSYLKAEGGLGERAILILNSISFLGGLGSLWILGARMDRLGSKPILTFSVFCWVFIVAGWLALAARLVPPGIPVILLLQFLMGLGIALVNMANLRLAMATSPVMGRNHFLALFSVVANVSLGLSPILWGILLDGLRAIDTVWQGFAWNRFSLFFALVLACLLFTLRRCRQLEEPEAVPFEDLLKEVFIEPPVRIWLRFWPRE